MRRGSSNLLIIIGLFLLLAAGAAGVLMFYAPIPGISAAAQADLPPTPEPLVPVVRAELDIEAGTVISTTDGLLTTEMVPISQFNADVNLASVEEARNMVATSSIKASEHVRKDQLRKAGLAQKMPAAQPGQASVKAFPVQVNSLSGVADLLQPGDFVDVIASFNLDVITFHPGVPTEGETGTTNSVKENATNEGTSKVLLQDIEVLDILKPPPPPAEEGAEGAPAQPTPVPPPSEQPEGTAAQQGASTAGSSLNPGNWIIVLAVTNQEAEALRFALDRGIGITTVLRAAGDHTTERSVGATMRILVENYGMPMPSFPQVVQQPGPAKIEGVTELPQIKTPAFAPEMQQPTP